MVHLYQYSENELTWLTSLKGHDSAITALHLVSTTTAYKLATADKRGSVRIWRVRKEGDEKGE